jgi:hypothetical protein
MQTPFQLLLFAQTGLIAAAADAAGIDGLVVDWENRGKTDRQAGFDTEINAHTREHLRRIRAATTRPIVCRLNGYGAWTSEEIEAALGDGADELLLPMVRRPDEAARALDAVRDRARLGVLIETDEAVRCRVALARLPLSRIYVGLNDLAIDRGCASIFDALVDGTVDAVRRDVDLPFGFGGLTLPHLGRPVPCHLLIQEMARLRCSFTFLRRSFLRDVAPADFAAATAQIREALHEASRVPARLLSDGRSALAGAIVRVSA